MRTKNFITVISIMTVIKFLEEQRSLIKSYSSCLHKYLSLSHGLICIPHWPVKIKYIYIYIILSVNLQCLFETGNLKTLL